MIQYLARSGYTVRYSASIHFRYIVSAGGRYARRMLLYPNLDTHPETLKIHYSIHMSDSVTIRHDTVTIHTYDTRTGYILSARARRRGGQGTQGHACAGTGAARCPSHPRLYPSMYPYCINVVSTSLRLAPLRLIHNDTLQDCRDTLIRYMPSDTIMIHTSFDSKQM